MLFSDHFDFKKPEKHWRYNKCKKTEGLSKSLPCLSASEIFESPVQSSRIIKPLNKTKFFEVLSG